MDRNSTHEDQNFNQCFSGLVNGPPMAEMSQSKEILAYYLGRREKAFILAPLGAQGAAWEGPQDGGARFCAKDDEEAEATPKKTRRKACKNGRR